MRQEEKRCRIAKLCKDKSTVIQALWRMFWKRGRYLVLRSRAVHAIICIQANYRRRPIQWRYTEIRAATMHLQSFARSIRSMRLLRKLRDARDRWLRRRHVATTKISKFWRGVVCLRRKFRFFFGSSDVFAKVSQDHPFIICYLAVHRL